MTSHTARRAAVVAALLLAGQVAALGQDPKGVRLTLREVTPIAFESDPLAPDFYDNLDRYRVYDLVALTTNPDNVIDGIEAVVSINDFIGYTEFFYHPAATHEPPSAEARFAYPAVQYTTFFSMPYLWPNPVRAAELYGPMTPELGPQMIIGRLNGKDRPYLWSYPPERPLPGAGNFVVGRFTTRSSARTPGELVAFQLRVEGRYITLQTAGTVIPFSLAVNPQVVGAPYEPNLPPPLAAPLDPNDLPDPNAPVDNGGFTPVHTVLLEQGVLGEDDADHDGIPDALDECPNDQLKSVQGICGCGRQELDTDQDGVPDCVDFCPEDPFKIAPGACGCGVIDEDADENGILDCIENGTVQAVDGGSGNVGGGAGDDGGDPAAAGEDANESAADAPVVPMCGFGTMALMPLTIAGLLARRRRR